MLRFCLVVGVLLTPTFGNAQDCSCDRVIPYSGTYRIDFPEKKNVAGSEIANITVVDGIEPGEVIKMSGMGGTMELSCGGPVYSGVMHPMAQPVNFAASSDQSGLGGLKMGDKFQGFVIRPELAATAHEEMTPTLEFTLTDGPRKATPLLCQRIKESIESFKIVQAAYANTVTIAVAQGQSLGAHSTGEIVYPDPGDGDSYTSDSNVTYRDLVKADYREVLTEAYFDPFFGVSGGIAGTNRKSCEIYHAQNINRDGTCRPEIELLAIKKHEEVHRDRCVAMDDDYAINNPYHKWSNHPANLSLDEVEAYDAAFNVLEPWYEEYCE